MGFLRLLLAFCVLSSHSQESTLYFFPPAQAVVLFFIISGFYMALILDGKYTSKIYFYISRALRIYPLYWIMLLLTVTLGIMKVWLHIGSDDNAILHYIKYSNHLTSSEAITESINFIVRNLTLIINKDYFNQMDNISPGYLILYQAWTLQVELLFYLVVPFILYLKKNLLIFVIFYFVIFYGIIQPFSIIPQATLTSKFLTCLPYFLIGLCSYQYIYKKISHSKPSHKNAIILSVFIIYIAAYQILPGKLVDQDFLRSIFYIIFALALPYIFICTKKNRIDRFLGELSYPLYITHIIFVKSLLSFSHPQVPLLNTIIVSAGTLAFSIVLVKFVQLPIDSLRLRFTSSHR